jgi:uncharacterized membrane protein
MKKATKRSVILGCVFVLLSAINLVMEYRKTNSTNLPLQWIMLVVLTIYAIVAFIRFKKAKSETASNK